MFGFLKKILKENSEVEKTFEIETEISKSGEKISITRTEGMLKIIVLENCTAEEFYRELATNLSIEEIEQLGNISRNSQEQRKLIYLIETNQAIYSIEKKYPRLRILEKSIKSSMEREIVLNQYKKVYKISRRIYDAAGNNLEQQEYDSESPYQKDLYLVRKRLKEETRVLLMNLKTVSNFIEELEMGDIYHDLDLLLEKEYVPVIQDNIISLCLQSLHKIDSIQKDRMRSFYIILEDTKEIVGEILYDYVIGEGFSYGGNTSYYIKSHFRNCHYATLALKLLKEFLKDHEFEGDKDLYISTEIENECSGRVAQNNAAYLVYEGEVPDGEIIKSLDGVEKVKVYRIMMN